MDQYFAFAGIFLNFLLLLQIFRRGIQRLFPIFTLFIAESFISAGVMLALYRFTSSPFYFKAYIVDLTISSILEFAVLAELIWSVLRPLHELLPRVAWLLSLVVLLLCALLMWPIAGFAVPANLSSFGHLYYKLQATIAILRILVFLTIAACSRLLALGWRDRELQIATGLGFYSIIYLAVTEIHVHQAVGGGYHFLDQLGVISYLLSLGYWLLMLGTSEVPRKEFTRTMESFMLRLTNNYSFSDSKVTHTPIVDSTEQEKK
jgi:hypothetical protein